MSGLNTLINAIFELGRSHGRQLEEYCCGCGKALYTGDKARERWVGKTPQTAVREVYCLECSGGK